MGVRTGRTDARIWPAILVALGACAASLCYWPGLVTYDSVRQYDQALSGDFDDWHPPAMEALWRLILPIWPSPAPMLLLQLGLYALGFVLMIRWAARPQDRRGRDGRGQESRGRPGLAIAIALCAWLPLSVALMGEVLKDCLMAGALLLAAALALPGIEGKRPGSRIAALLLTCFAASLRFNAFTAGLPILLVAAGPALRATKLRIAATSLVSIVALLAVMPLTNAALGAKSSGVSLSLVIFDLAGITEHSGQDAFPPLGLKDPVAIVHQCYTPLKWDSFSWWVEPVCPLDFERVRKAVRAQGLNGYVWLAGQIVRHPLAYAQHRLTHWNIETRFLLNNEVERPVQRESAPNDWGFKVSDGAALDRIDGIAVAAGYSAVGWPCVWMALAAGALLVARRLRSGGAIAMLAGSALLFALGYGVFGVAAELRYYLWTMIATALAVVIAGADLCSPRQTRRLSSAVILLAPAVLVTLAAYAARGLLG